MHGSPCQDFSAAGQGKGGDKDSGTHSSLMYETLRIVEKLKPKYVIWENVKNLLSKKHRHNFGAYLETMEQLDYTNYYQVLNAKDYGIPQNRERVFTISIRKDINKVFTFPQKQELKLKLEDMLEEEVGEKYYWNINDLEILKKQKTEEINFKWNSKVRKFIHRDDINIKGTYSLNAYNNSINYISHTLTIPHNILFVLHKGKIRKTTPSESWTLMGFDKSDYEKASKVNSNTQLYKQAGNSIVVNVLEAILTNLFLDTEQEKIGQTNIYDFIGE